MKLFYAATSPFVRKCLVSAHELGLRERLELVPAAPHPVSRDRTLVASNPLGKIPTLITDDGAVLYDSRVICEYLNALAEGALIPPHGPARGLLGRVDAGSIAVGCALGYLNFRFASLEWREKCPATAAWFEQFGKRESMAVTRPPAA